MDEFERGKFGFFVFFLIVIFLGVVGFYYVTLDKSNKDNKNKNEVKEISNEYKLDKSKPFIYVEEESMLAHDVVYSKATINLNSGVAQEINTLLTTELETIKKDVLLLSKTEIPEGKEIVHSHDDIYKAAIRDFEVYLYDKYATLVIYDYYHYCTDEYGAKNMRAYTFNVETGKLLSSEDVLNVYGKSLESIKEKIQTHLTRELSELVTSDPALVNFIEISNSLSNLTYNKSLIYYIDVKGKLNASFVVITAENDYNDNVIFD